MPTGYTADVVDGKVSDFKSFALQCARAFGALITMRDDPYDAPIPDEFKPDDYYEKRLEEVKDHLVDLQSWTEDKMLVAHALATSARKEEREKNRARNLLENQRLDDMLAKVKDWQPPSIQHSEMKSFMIEQLSISKHDLSYVSNDKYWTIEPDPKKWYREQLKDAEESVGRYTAEYAKEVERCKSRTLWVKQLSDSLK